MDNVLKELNIKMEEIEKDLSLYWSKNLTHTYGVSAGILAGLKIAKDIILKYENKWIPLNTGIYPNEMEDMQVTFIGYTDHMSHCEEFAYMNEGKWY